MRDIFVVPTGTGFVIRGERGELHGEAELLSDALEKAQLLAKSADLDRVTVMLTTDEECVWVYEDEEGNALDEDEEDY